MHIEQTCLSAGVGNAGKQDLRDSLTFLCCFHNKLYSIYSIINIPALLVRLCQTERQNHVHQPGDKYTCCYLPEEGFPAP